VRADLKDLESKQCLEDAWGCSDLPLPELEEMYTEAQMEAILFRWKSPGAVQEGLAFLEQAPSPSKALVKAV
jgi:hypothetical protein